MVKIRELTPEEEEKYTERRKQEAEALYEDFLRLTTHRQTIVLVLSPEDSLRSVKTTFRHVAEKMGKSVKYRRQVVDTAPDGTATGSRLFVEIFDQSQL